MVKRAATAAARLRGAPSRRAFTLVELLAVIIIIGILAGLITAAAVPAIRAARQAVIIGEISQLDMALERYKQEHVDYPPDFCGVGEGNPDDIKNAARAAVLSHLRKAFPRYQPGVSGGGGDGPWERFCNDVLEGTNDKLDVNNMTPAGALVFWLGGLPAPDGSSTRLIPFSANPANPFAESGSRLQPFFEFDETRLVEEGDGRYVYRPPHVEDPDGGPDAPPYVYFRARHDEYDPAVQQFRWPAGASDPSATLCVPYGKDAAGDPIAVSAWFNPKTHQIVCSGLDGWYGKEGDLNATRYLQREGQLGGNLTPEEDDNLTNFSKGALGDWNEEK
ncbi:MAG: prepilin-type N-terminal cleavage/methylation domain-containing protein [Pirellulales bacterium]|nr:prepilin-type N-terminal cleavage/methylation domain-containing protein [Pirellulales bacterium]